MKYVAIALAVAAWAGYGGSSSRRSAATTTAGLSTNIAVPGSLSLPIGDPAPVESGISPFPTEPPPPVTPPPPATPRHWYVGDALGNPLKTHSPAEEKKAMALLQLLGCVRKQRGLPPLALDPEATRAAKAHAEDMLGRAYFGKVTPEGLTTDDRLKLLGATGYAAADEVVAMEPGGRCSLTHAMKSLLSGGPSKKALLSRDFTHLGIGVASPEGKQGVLSAVLLRRGAPTGKPVPSEGVTALGDGK